MKPMTFGLNLWLNTEISSVSPMNHSAEAISTPVMNGVDCDMVSVALKAPSISVPSMMACGLSHVTTPAVMMVLSSSLSPPKRDAT